MTSIGLRMLAISPKGKARGLKNKERPLQLAEVDSFPVWEATKRLTIFADFCNSKNRVKESRAKKRAPLIRRRAATPFPPRGRLKTLTEVAFSDSFPVWEAERAV
mgnify:CR=1 FL=1